MNNDFSEKIMKTIQEHHIAPTPKIFFFLKNISFWIVAVLSLLIGSISLAASIFELSQEIELPQFLSLFPVFWLTSFSLFIILGYFGYHATPRGYRIPLPFLFLGNLGLSLLFGTAFFFIGIGESADRIADVSLPFYHSHEMRRRQVWTAPEEGRISGTIISLPDEQNPMIEIEDFEGAHWQVISSPDDNLLIEYGSGDTVRIMGKQTQEKVFEAHQIFSWRRGVKQQKNKSVNLKTNKIKRNIK